MHYVISGALEQAVRWRHLGVNPAAFAIAPTANHTEPDPPSAEEAAAVISAALNDPDWGLLLWVIMITGMRRGEISALRWRHVDFATATLIVQRANAQPKAGVKEKQTKTRQQRRIAIDPQTAALLLEHRERWAATLRAARLSLFRDDLFVFSPVPDASSPYGPRSLSHRYRRLAIKLGLRSTRLHSLRHYSATELIAAGVDVRTVAGRLGHGSGGATTLKVYAAFVDEADRRAATTMAGIMPPPVAAPRTPRGPYEVIAADLREQIATGQLRPGDQLPTSSNWPPARGRGRDRAPRARPASPGGPDRGLARATGNGRPPYNSLNSLSSCRDRKTKRACAGRLPRVAFDMIPRAAVSREPDPQTSRGQGLVAESHPLPP